MADIDAYEGNIFRVVLGEPAVLANKLCIKSNLAKLKRPVQHRFGVANIPTVSDGASSTSTPTCSSPASPTTIRRSDGPLTDIVDAAEAQLPSYDFAYEAHVRDFVARIRAGLTASSAANAILYGEYAARRTIVVMEAQELGRIATLREKDSIRLAVDFVHAAENKVRRGIEDEFVHFHAFCSANEPIWKMQASDRGVLREVVDEAVQFKRRWFSEEVEGFFVATKFSEEDEVSVLFPALRVKQEQARAPAVQLPRHHVDPRQSLAPSAHHEETPPMDAPRHFAESPSSEGPTRPVAAQQFPSTQMYTHTFELPPNLQNVRRGVQPLHSTYYSTPDHLRDSGFSAGAGSNFNAPPHLTCSQWNSAPAPCTQYEQQYGGANYCNTGSPPPSAPSSWYSQQQQQQQQAGGIDPKYGRGV